MANLVGIVLLLIGWGVHSGALILLGFAVLVVSLGARIAGQLNSRASRDR